MNDNGNKTESLKNGRTNVNRGLGRGLRDILAEQSVFDGGFNELQSPVKAARIGAAVLELIGLVEAKYQPVIFRSVAAYRAVCEEESTEEIGLKLAELERRRIQQDLLKRKPKRQWRYLFLR